MSFPEIPKLNCSNNEYSSKSSKPLIPTTGTNSVMTYLPKEESEQPADTREVSEDTQMPAVQNEQAVGTEKVQEDTSPKNSYGEGVTAFLGLKDDATDDAIEEAIREQYKKFTDKEAQFKWVSSLITHAESDKRPKIQGIITIEQTINASYGELIDRVGNALTEIENLEQTIPSQEWKNFRNGEEVSPEAKENIQKYESTTNILSHITIGLTQNETLTAAQKKELATSVNIALQSDEPTYRRYYENILNYTEEHPDIDRDKKFTKFMNDISNGNYSRIANDIKNGTKTELVIPESKEETGKKEPKSDSKNNKDKPSVADNERKEKEKATEEEATEDVKKEDAQKELLIGFPQRKQPPLTPRHYKLHDNDDTPLPFVNTNHLTFEAFEQLAEEDSIASVASKVISGEYKTTNNRIIDRAIDWSKGLGLAQQRSNLRFATSGVFDKMLKNVNFDVLKTLYDLGQKCNSYLATMEIYKRVEEEEENNKTTAQG